MRIPIDTAGLTFIAGNNPSMVVDMEGKPRADRATGEVLWGLDLVALGSQDGAEVWTVRVAGEPKGVQLGQPLAVEGLVATPWEIDGRHGISFRARKLAVVGGSQAKPAAPAA
ncbi:MAG: hypothetical protein Q8O56_03560 [Solirubrobacteraceae bacterium]|nr:hypothetical protein [Solirubrobacteraceae bacterium]